MADNSKEPISLKFLVFVLITIIGLGYYISIPKETAKDEIAQESAQESAQEPVKNYTKSEDNLIDLNLKPQKSNFSPKIQTSLPAKTEQNSIQQTPTAVITYEELLDSIKDYPISNSAYLKNIVNKLLVYKGYPADIIDIKYLDNSQANSKSEDIQMAANFDFKTGNLNISKKIINTSDKRMIIAILVHELDHFDKLAKVCKYMGIEKFKELFETNRIPQIDTIFWTKAAKYAKLDGFNSEYYQKALERFLTQNDLELLSSYSDFYKLAENMRNPLEVSAYEASDYVYNHYNIKLEEGPMRKLTKIFNDADWAVFEQAKKYSLLENERIPVFDYFFMKSIIKKYPELNKELEICIKTKNGDLTSFWLAFEHKFSDFYIKHQLDNYIFENMSDLLTSTENLAKNGLTAQEGAFTLQYKLETLRANLVYPNAIENLKKTSFNYIKFIKEYNIQNDKEEFNCILNLICIENKLYKDNANKKMSLYYINIPQDLLNLYNIKDKRQFLLYLYKNKYFKSIQGSNNESQVLINLLNNNRLDIRIKD